MVVIIAQNRTINFFIGCRSNVFELRHTRLPLLPFIWRVIVAGMLIVYSIIQFTMFHYHTGNTMMMMMRYKSKQQQQHR